MSTRSRRRIQLATRGVRLGERLFGIAVAAACLAWLPCATASQGPPLLPPVLVPGSPAQIDQRITEVLAGSALPKDQLARALAALGPKAVPPMIARLRAPSGPELRAELESALLAALARHPAETRAWLTEIGRAGLAPEDALACVRVLGEIGRAADLKLLLRAATPTETQEPATELVERTTRSLADLLRRDAAGFETLQSLYPSTHASLQPFVLRAVGDSGERAGLAWLSRASASSVELERQLMVEIGRLAAALEPPFDDAVLLDVRSRMTSDDTELCREAALAAGRLDDAESVPELVALLDNADRGVRVNAHWSLKAITALSLPLESRRWSHWLQGEQNWWRTRAPELFAAARRGSRAERTEAVHQIAQHRWRRHELALELAAALDPREPTLATLACSALRDLGSRACEPTLLACLEEPALREEAQRTLEALRSPVAPQR